MIEQAWLDEDDINSLITKYNLRTKLLIEIKKLELEIFEKKWKGDKSKYLKGYQKAIENVNEIINEVF